MTKETLFYRQVRVGLQKIANANVVKATRRLIFNTAHACQTTLIIYILHENTGYIWFLI